MGQTMSLRVDYKSADGWHVFSSMDLPGFYVASKNAEAAYNDVSASIMKLLKLNEGIECFVTPDLSYLEFVNQARAPQPSAKPALAESAPMLETQRYNVRLCA